MEEKTIVVPRNVTDAQHIITTTIGERNDEPKKVSHI